MKSQVLILVFLFLPLCSFVHAQDKSVSDTISYILKKNKKPVKQCDSLYALAAYYFNIGNADNALPVVLQVKSIAEKNDYKKGFYDANALLGAIRVKQNDFQKAFSIARDCLEHANKNHSSYGVIRANYLLAFIFSLRGLPDSVIAVGMRTMEAPYEAYDSVNLTKFIGLIGNAYLDKADYPRASKCYLDALAIADKINNEPMQAVCIANLALINISLRNYDEALDYERKALSIAQKHNHIQNVAKCYYGMGSIYRELHQPDSALINFKKGLQWFTQFGMAEDIAQSHTNIGAAFIDLNQPDSGLYYLRLAQTEFEVMKDTMQTAINSLMLGSAWRMLWQQNKNKSYFQNALKELEVCRTIAEDRKIEDLKMNCYYQLALLYESLGNDSKAFWYLKLYSLINDSIRSQQYTRQIAEIKTKYDFEKKELEVNKLNAENLLGLEKISRQKILNYSLLAMAGLMVASGSVVIRNVQKKRRAEKQVAVLEKQNAIENMRSKIASDVHDEMGANLTRLGLNAQQLLLSPVIPENEKLLAEKMSLQSKEIITGMREIIWSSNPANDNLRSMLGFMRQYIDRFFDGTQIRPVVNFPHEVGEVTLHPEVRRNLFLILKESLNNSVKYSGADRIDIDFHTEKDRFEFRVKDYGKGLEDKNKDDFTSGMRNMQMRAEQIQSMFRMVTAPGQGVQIIVEGRLY